LDRAPVEINVIIRWLINASKGMSAESDKVFVVANAIIRSESMNVSKGVCVKLDRRFAMGNVIIQSGKNALSVNS
jgi:hypothetical protein